MTKQFIGFIMTSMAGAESATISVTDGEPNVIDERSMMQRKAEVQGLSGSGE